ncbi:unnamed protein product, partial [marine sediment metagenome]
MINQQLLYPQPNPDLILNDNIFCNEYGAHRLHLIRPQFGLESIETGKFYKDKLNKFGDPIPIKYKEQTRPLAQLDLDQLIDFYTSSRDLDEVVPIKYVYQDKEVRKFETTAHADKYVMFMNDHFNVVLPQSKNVVTVPFESYKYHFPHACKRGNSVYIDIVKERFKPFLEQEPITFFDPAYVGNRNRKSKTNMLYITGTTNPKTCGYDRGWLSFGKRWNSFITNLRKQFGS